jgi:long-chain acyl-CoA synthetase
VFNGESTTYAALNAMSNKIGNALQAMGVGKGDAVGIYCINSPYYVATYFAIVKIGARVVPVNLLIGSEVAAFELADAEVKALVYIDVLAAQVAEIRARLPQLENVIVIGQPGEVGGRALADVMAHESAELTTVEVDTRQDLAAILYTSGTTGKPKGAMLSHHNLLFNVNSISGILPVDENDVFLTVLPMFHSFGTTVGMLLPTAVGATIAAVPRFLPDLVASVIQETNATVFMGVPSMYGIYANIPEARRPDLSSLRYCLAGGASLPVNVLERFEAAYGVTIHEGDGPTECSPVTAVNPFDGRPRKPGSIGPPVPGVEMRIVDDHGEDVALGEMGEIVVRGDNVMQGYLKLDEQTAEVFFDDWYRTGDMGFTDADGYFYIVDRIKDLIIVNGMNVYPRIVEEVVMRHPAVAEAAVVPEPHKLHGEVPRACVVLREGESAEASDIMRFCRDHLGRHEVPKVIDFMDDLPRLPTGKVLKRALRRTGETERGIDIPPAP